MTGRSLRVLVSCRPGEPDEAALRLACSLASVGMQVEALAVTVVPPTLPMLGLPAEIDQGAMLALDAARCFAKVRGTAIETRLRRGRDATRVLLQEAYDSQTDLLLLPLRPRRFRFLPRLGRAEHEVLRHASCPVLLSREYVTLTVQRFCPPRGPSQQPIGDS